MLAFFSDSFLTYSETSELFSFTDGIGSSSSSDSFISVISKVSIQLCEEPVIGKLIPVLTLTLLFDLLSISIVSDTFSIAVGVNGDLAFPICFASLTGCLLVNLLSVLGCDVTCRDSFSVLH